ncbi:Uncharacterised protein [Moraxella ovis]|uniref:Uncharacterized protein n=1 Tax=Moraxella ovis TaxID=29433 RepID=A0A378PQH6_9GAMM|nr:hypothetical protein [Moraxella ovis]STY87189.1 Uncharacterised protein [Moraxella ovis]
MGLTPKPKGRKAVSKKHNANQNKLTNKTTSKPSWQAKPDNEKALMTYLLNLPILEQKTTCASTVLGQTT